MIRTILFYVRFVGSLVLMVPKMRRMYKLREQLPPDEFAVEAERFTGDWAANRLKNSGARMTVKGLENVPEGAVLFVANHQGNFDIAVLMSCIRKPKGFVSKIQAKKIPFVNQWMRFMGSIFLDRDDMRQQAKSMLEGIKILQNGHSLIIFPEGTRSDGKPVGEFKVGSFKLATKSKVPIVPVTIDGTHKIMRIGSPRICAADVALTIHPPIITADLTPEETAGLMERVKGIIVSAM